MKDSTPITSDTQQPKKGMGCFPIDREYNLGEVSNKNSEMKCNEGEKIR